MINNNYKIKTAEALTELAIQNNLISKYGSEKETAEAVCTFFKTIVENLDSSDE